MADSLYKAYQEQPDYVQAVFKDGKLEPGDSLLPKWSGVNSPPQVGECVAVTMNAVGPAKVEGYFTESGWLGLLVKPLNPPEWFVKQNGYNASAHVFGAEIAPDIIPEPEIIGPNQEQLAALQAYANRVGRAWKSLLCAAWLDGSDRREENGHLLRQIRNQFGPSWLYSSKRLLK